jgi:glycosyltransferase involved in cell wall biosynthesis
MKSILIGPAFPLRGGIANFNEALHLQYLRQGDDSQIISYSLQYPGFLFPGKTQFATDAPTETYNIATILNSINPFSWIAVGRKIKKAAPDVLIIHYWMPFFAPALGTICRIVRRNKSTKIIVICHNVKPHESRIGDTFLAKYFLKKCHGFVAMSNSTLDDLSLYTDNPNKTFIPHPIYDSFGSPVTKAEARAKLQLKANDKYLLFFGVVRKYKGLDLLLKAMGDAKMPHDVKLIIAGEFYEDPKIYHDLIDVYDLKDRVIIKNEFIASNDVKYYFCASDMVAQTYHTATQSGVSQIAYHFEIPMLVTDVGGLAEIVPHEKVGYVAQCDPSDIASHIFDYFNHKREAEFIENIKVEKLRFSWANLTEGISKLIINYEL